MRTASLCVLVCFVFLSLLGFVGMLESSTHEASRCLASLAQNGACPPEDGTLASVIFHTGAFKVFSTTLISVALIAALALSIAAFIAGAAPPLASFFVPAQKRTRLLLRYLALRRLIRALTRLEHSPTTTLRAA